MIRKEDMITLGHLKPVIGILGVGYGSAFLYISLGLLNKVKYFVRALPAMLLDKIRGLI